MSIESIKTAIEERAKNASPLGAILKFKMDDQAITIDGNGSENVVSAEDKDADCTIKIAEKDFNAILSGDLNPMGAFMSGKIKVEGDMGLAMKLQSLLG